VPPHDAVAPLPAPATSAEPAAIPVSTKPLSTPPASILLGGLPLDRAESLSDLPPAVQAALVAAADVVDLASDEEVSDFGIILVLAGEIAVCATINDAPACRFVAGALVPASGSFQGGVATRAVAFAGPARIARWNPDALREALQSCPWVVDELEERGDRVQARVGATLGPLGDLDDTTRTATLDALSLRVFAPGDTVLAKDAPGTGIMIIGGGSIEILGDGAREILGCGDPLFASAALSNSPAPAEAKAGNTGALLLIADRRGTQTLVSTLPTLLELLSMA